MEKDFSVIEKSIGVKFKSKKLLKQAHTHRSYLNENPDSKMEHNERLEFLGDAVLELVVTEYLYENYNAPEGELTNWRASLVNAQMLAKKAHVIGLNDCLLLSRGETKDIGKAREIILANAFEALVGAIYLDQGIKPAEKFLKKVLLVDLPYIISHKLYMDPKSKLQEETQGLLNITPLYKVLEEWGPDHEKKFKVGAYLEDFLLAQGEGSSKQEAQVDAAEKALKKEMWKKYKK